MQLIAWLNSHAAAIAVALALVTLFLRAAKAVAALYAPAHPRLAAAVEVLAAASPDVVRALAKAFEVLTGRRVPPLWLLLGDVLQAPAPAPSSPAADPDASGRPTLVPTVTFNGPHAAAAAAFEEVGRAVRRRVLPLGAQCVALALLLGATGCASGGDATTTALRAGVTVLEGASTARRFICSRALDPILGDPRAAEASPAPRSSGGSAPSSPPAPAPAPPPAVAPPPTAATPNPSQDGGPS